jgi:hypothetical protein
MGLACIAFLGSLFFAPLTKHPCPVLFHQSISPSTLDLALFATTSSRQQQPPGPAISGFTYLA